MFLLKIPMASLCNLAGETFTVLRGRPNAFLADTIL